MTDFLPHHAMRKNKALWAAYYTGASTAPFLQTGVVMPEPLTFESLSPALQEKLQRAGTHGEYRSLEETIEFWKSDLPDPIKATGDESYVWRFLEGKHAAHEIPYSAGGSNTTDNLTWLPAEDNLRMGDTPMTPEQVSAYEAANQAEAEEFFQEALGTEQYEVFLENLGGGAAVAGFYVALIQAIHYGFAWKRGEVSGEVAVESILRGFTAGAITGAAVGLGVAIICMLFPPLGSLFTLAAPLLGLSAYFKIAQAIVREIQIELSRGRFRSYGIEAEGY